MIGMSHSSTFSLFLNRYESKHQAFLTFLYGIVIHLRRCCLEIFRQCQQLRLPRQRANVDSFHAWPKKACICAHTHACVLLGSVWWLFCPSGLHACTTQCAMHVLHKVPCIPFRPPSVQLNRSRTAQAAAEQALEEANAQQLQVR